MYYIVIRMYERSGELNISSFVNLQSSLKSLIVFVLDFSDLVIPERSPKYPNQVLIHVPLWYIIVRFINSTSVFVDAI